MATGRKKTFEDLTPEQQAKVLAARARWNTPEARAAEVRDREALLRERDETGHIAAEGDPADPRDLVRFNRLAEALKARREAAGLSLATVAERSGIDQGALSRLENGRGNPTLHTLARYARAVGARIEWAVEESEG